MAPTRQAVSVDTGTLWILIWCVIVVLVAYWLLSWMRRVEKMLREVREKLDAIAQSHPQDESHP
jgi:TRAP-type C4-dicarboxylate transport system permease small subunit